MKERPILMSAPMVRAILAGAKRQTRRIAMPKRSIEPMTDECPYGQPGDRLWVRETWQSAPLRGVFAYRADPMWSGVPAPTPDGRWRPSIHMPRCASRITLEITGVRVERLRDINEDDAIAEGIQPAALTGHWRLYGRGANGDMDRSPRVSYRSLWESINGQGSWDANPWVWVIEFRRVTESAA